MDGDRDPENPETLKKPQMSRVRPGCFRFSGFYGFLFPAISPPIQT
jgi:hypothetical protein